MSAWGWVTLAYLMTFLTLGAYSGLLAHRIRTARRRLQDLE